jgi:ribosome biogenesis protein Nip4
MAAMAVSKLPKCGDDDDGQVRPLIQEAAAQVQSIHLRHVDVDQRRIEIAVRHGGQRLFGGGRATHLKSLSPEAIDDQPAQGCVVVYDQNRLVHGGVSGL